MRDAISIYSQVLLFINYSCQLYVPVSFSTSSDAFFVYVYIEYAKCCEVSICMCHIQHLLRTYMQLHPGTYLPASWHLYYILADFFDGSCCYKSCPSYRVFPPVIRDCQVQICILMTRCSEVVIIIKARGFLTSLIPCTPFSKNYFRLHQVGKLAP